MTTKTILGVAACTSVWIAGCDKGNTANAPATNSSTGATVTTPAAAAVSAVVGSYEYKAANPAGPDKRQDQVLTLNADMTAGLETTLRNPAGHQSESGTYKAEPDKVVVTMATRDGAPIPAADKSRVMELERTTGSKELTAGDKREFHKAP